jgi:hypothetical protein
MKGYAGFGVPSSGLGVRGSRILVLAALMTIGYVLTTSTPGNAATFSGGNVAVFIPDDGVTLVDTKLAGWGQAILDKLKTVTNKPVTRIVQERARQASDSGGLRRAQTVVNPLVVSLSNHEHVARLSTGSGRAFDTAEQ